MHLHVNIFIDHRQHNANLHRILFNNSTGTGAGNGNEQVTMKPIRDGACCVCSDENGWADNPLVYCEGPNCQVAVHQGLCVRALGTHTRAGCYGIVSVPDGSWYCARCAASASDSQCVLCPQPGGALKRTQNGGWAHVVCALYIPEVEFGDVHSMDPVKTDKMPESRFNQVLCSQCVCVPTCNTGVLSVRTQ